MGFSLKSNKSCAWIPPNGNVRKLGAWMSVSQNGNTSTFLWLQFSSVSLDKSSRETLLCCLNEASRIQIPVHCCISVELLILDCRPKWSWVLHLDVWNDLALNLHVKSMNVMFLTNVKGENVVWFLARDEFHWWAVTIELQTIHITSIQQVSFQVRLSWTASVTEENKPHAPHVTQRVVGKYMPPATETFTYSCFLKSAGCHVKKCQRHIVTIS